MASSRETGIAIKVELFGTARLLAGKRDVALSLSRVTHRRDLVSALADACPQLVGPVLLQDLSNLQEGYVLNRSGTAFLSGDVVSLEPGDSLLILSSQAGG